MVDDYDFVLDQLDEYYRSVLNLARMSPEDRINEIEHLGRSFKELSKLNFPELDDKDHDPFTGTMYSISTGDTQNERDEYNKWYEDKKIELLVDFYKRKRSQIGMLKEKKKSSLESKNSVPVSSPKEKEHHWWNDPKYWISIGVTIVIGALGLIFSI